MNQFVVWYSFGIHVYLVFGIGILVYEFGIHIYVKLCVEKIIHVCNYFLFYENFRGNQRDRDQHAF